MHSYRSRILPGVGTHESFIEQLELSQLAAAVQVISVVQCVGSQHKLEIGAFIERPAQAEHVFSRGRFRLGQGAALIFEEGQEQARADTVIGGNIIHHLRAGAVLSSDIAAVILQPAVRGGDKRRGAETDLRGTVHKRIVRDALKVCSPKRKIVDGDLHRKAGRHGRRICGDDGIGRPDFFFGCVKSLCQSGQGIAALSNVVHQLARRVIGPAGGGGGDRCRRDGCDHISEIGARADRCAGSRKRGD